MFKKVFVFLIAAVVAVTIKDGYSQPLRLEKVGTEQVYFSYHGKPLLSFGSMSDFIFYAAEDAYNYKMWADWQASHGMNHCRAYLPGSWVYVEKFAKENGGSIDNVLFPFKEIKPGSRQFDLTQFDEHYWKRFREQCLYLQSKGIILDLLMLNGWQMFNYNQEVAEYNWDGHFFNPKNNINASTKILNTDKDKDNRLKFYHSAVDNDQELFKLQKKYYEKIIEMTYDLDNIYYELVHELGMNYSEWQKVSIWLEKMSHVIRKKWREYNPDRSIILSTDGGHLAGYPFRQGGGFPITDSEMDWVFSRPFFDIIISGNHHYPGNIREWVKKYKKPYVAQESNDDSGQRWTYRRPETRTHLRKYVWKLMMSKCQQIDIYCKPINSQPIIEDQMGPLHNYNPNGWNAFEDDASLLRQFFDSIIDYGSLEFKGYFFLSSGGHNMVLSSAWEILAYISSPTGLDNIEYSPKGAMVWLYDLPFPDGQYEAHFFDPKSGPAKSQTISINGETTFFRTPVFLDDYAIRIIR
jgi:hypothetical protein